MDHGIQLVGYGADEDKMYWVRGSLPLSTLAQDLLMACALFRFCVRRPQLVRNSWVSWFARRQRFRRVMCF